MTKKNGAVADAPVTMERLDTKRIVPVGASWNVHCATVPSTTPYEHVLDGDFWRRCAPRMQRGDHIEWRDDSLMRFGELVVIALDVATARCEVRELSYREVAPATLGESEIGGFRAVDLGIHDKWAVVRVADNQQVAKNIPSFDEAARRIRTEFIPQAAAEALRAARVA